MKYMIHDTDGNGYEMSSDDNSTITKGTFVGNPATIRPTMHHYEPIRKPWPWGWICISVAVGLIVGLLL